MVGGSFKRFDDLEDPWVSFLDIEILHTSLFSSFFGGLD